MYSHQIPRCLLVLLHLFPFTPLGSFLARLPSSNPQGSATALLGCGGSHILLWASCLCQCPQCGQLLSQPFSGSRPLLSHISFSRPAQPPNCACCLSVSRGLDLLILRRNRGQCTPAPKLPSLCVHSSVQAEVLPSSPKLPCAVLLIPSLVYMAFLSSWFPPLSLLHLPFRQVFPTLHQLLPQTYNAIRFLPFPLCFIDTYLERELILAVTPFSRATDISTPASIWLLSTTLDWIALPVVINGLLIVESNRIFSVIVLDLSVRLHTVWPKASSFTSFPTTSPLLTPPQQYWSTYWSANKPAPLFHGLCMCQCLCLQNITLSDICMALFFSSFASLCKCHFSKTE